MSNRNPQVRTPHDPALSGRAVHELLDQWSWTRSQLVLGELLEANGTDPADCFTELSLGARIVDEIGRGRWCVVARLLRLGAAESWRALADALDLAPEAARNGFHTWIAEQLQLHHQSRGAFGMDRAEADEVSALAHSLRGDSR